MNDRVKAIKEFQQLNCRNLNYYYMRELYIRIFDFEKRYLLAEAIDFYVDIKHFIENGIEIIESGCDTWYKKDFIDAGLIK